LTRTLWSPGGFQTCNGGSEVEGHHRRVTLDGVAEGFALYVESEVRAGDFIEREAASH
jgi:hypothetical protein